MVFDKLKKLIVEQFNVEEDAVTMDATLEDLGADSLDMVELVMAMEEELDIEFADEDVEKLHSVEDLVEYINGKIQ